MKRLGIVLLIALSVAAGMSGVPGRVAYAGSLPLRLQPRTQPPAMPIPTPAAPAPPQVSPPETAPTSGYGTLLYLAVLVLGGLIPPAITAVAAFLHARSVRTPAAVALATGAVGVVAIALASTASSNAGVSDAVTGALTTAFLIIRSAFALLFSVSLYLVLRESRQGAARKQEAEAPG
jgi:hypothetical protein